MNIIASYDASVNSAPAGYVGAIQSAISYLDATITTSVTVNIAFGWGEVAGQAIDPRAAGENTSSGFLTSYAAVKSALAAVATSTDDMASVATLTSVDPTGGGRFFVTQAEAQVLGLTGSTTATAGWMGLSSAINYTFDPANRAVAGLYDAIGVIEHEITEILGRVGSLGAYFGAGVYTPLDLFRYSSAGVRDLAPGPGFFSVNGQTMLTAYNDPTAGGDATDWVTSLRGDSFGSAYQGIAGTVTPTDLRELDVLGYKIAAASPPPPVSPPPVSPPPVSPPPVSPPPPPSGVVLTAASGGSNLAGGAGADTLIGGTGPDTLTGGGGADDFTFNILPPHPGHITDFTPGVDKLDLTALLKSVGYAGSDPIADGYIKLLQGNPGETWVVFDQDGKGTATPWGWQVTILDHTNPGSVGLSDLVPVSGAVSPPPPPPPPPVSPPPPPPPPSGVVLTAASGGSNLVGGAGADTLIGGTGPDTLTGGGGADDFTFTLLPPHPGHITDFTPGVDKLDLTALLKGVGYAGSDPIADGYIKLLQGNPGETWVVFDQDGKGTATPWGWQVTILDHTNPGSVGLSDLVPVSGAVSPPPPPPPPPVSPPPPPPPPSGVVLTAAPGGSNLVGGAGADTLIGGTGPDTLTGGGGADDFTFNILPPHPGHITDFTPGVDKLDLTALLKGVGYAGSDPIADGYIKLLQGNPGETWVVFDQDGKGTATPWGWQVTILDHTNPGSVGLSDLVPVSGAVSPPPPPPPPSGVVLTAAPGGSNLVGGAGADTLIGGTGPDTLTGGGGADDFTFNILPPHPGHITDFTPGVDKLDLTALLKSVGYTGTDPVADGYVKFLQGNAGETWLVFDQDGKGTATPWGWQVTILDHTNPGSLSVNDLVPVTAAGGHQDLGGGLQWTAQPDLAHATTFDFISGAWLLG